MCSSLAPLLISLGGHLQRIRPPETERIPIKATATPEHEGATPDHQPVCDACHQGCNAQNGTNRV